ncbi:hypothetical protein MBLNU457_g0554t2 [Dothideomycetes sp. NU457]
MSADQYQAHDTSYSVQVPTYQPYIAAAGSRQLTQVTTFQPQQGPAGRRLHVYLNSSDDLESTQQYLNVVFGSRRAQGILQKLSTPTHQQGNYVLSVDVPAFDATGSSNTQIPLYLDLGDGSTPMSFGTYQYTDATAFGIASPSPSLSRKRKLSNDMGAIASPSLGKRTSSNTLSDGFENSSPSAASGLSPFNQQPPNVNYALAGSRPQAYGSMPPTSQATPRYGHSPQTAASHLNIQSSAYYGPGSYLSDRSPVPQNPMVGQVTTSGASNPTLVRTSTLNGDVVGPVPVSNYHSYPYQSNTKAVLKLDGDLNSMTENWKADEVSTQRRLVRFTRSQSNNTITAQFQPVTLEDHAKAPGHIYVNCIYWKEKGQCYITSVDTIQLLEALVAVRFTVEEKNRIRRNLEGFRPATVSKTRADCEEFFKTIMGFPSPKPRNIEKDVKVFPWRILGHALKKIIGKYSASYNGNPPVSTVVAPGMNGYSASASSGMNNHGRPTSSPPSGSAQVSSVQYGGHMPVTTMTSAGPMLGSSGAPAASMGQSMSWHQPTSNYTTDMSTRAGWDYNGQYMVGQPQNSGHAAAQAMTNGVPSLRDYGRLPSLPQSYGTNY